MAYINATEVKAIRNTLKTAFPDFKFSVRGRDHTSVDVAILSGPMDFDDSVHYQINHFYINEQQTPQWAALLHEVLHIIKCAGKKYYDNSDSMTDYFDVAFYFNITVGTWNKKYQRVVPKKFKGDTNWAAAADVALSFNKLAA